MNVTNTSTFIQKASIVHNNKYDYSLVDYTHTSGIVNIICPIHGAFSQPGNKHLQGAGCRLCSNINISKVLMLTTEGFIEKAKSIHKDKYNYSLVNYTGSHKPVLIICPIHGAFPQTPSNHLQGCGCKDCANINKSKQYTLTTEEFIQKARLVHGDIYDYSQVDYACTSSNINIICPIHGSFPQTPSNHLQGTKCPSCISQTSKGQEDIFNFIQSIYPNTILEDRVNYP